jgi:hypothetical protein
MEQGLSVSSAKEMFRVHGANEAIEMLSALATKDQKNMLLRVMRKATQPLVRDARANVGSYSRRISSSIKAWQPRGSRRNDNPVLFVGVKSNWRGYGDPTDPWFAHMVEYGTEGIKRKISHRKRSTDNETSFFRIRSAATSKGQRYRKNISARPFWDPAVQANESRVSKVLINDITDELHNMVEQKKR